MTRSELISRITQHFSQLQMQDIELSTLVIINAISEQLANSGRVEVRGFGTFQIHIRDPRISRNPKTGDQVAVPQKAIPHFKAGKELRDRVNIQN